MAKQYINLTLRWKTLYITYIFPNIGDKMERASLIEGLRILKIHESMSALVEPINEGTAFYVTDPEKIAAIKVIFNEKLAEERAHVDLSRIIRDLKILSTLDAKMKITEKKTRIQGGYQMFEMNNLDIGIAPVKYDRSLKLPASFAAEKADLLMFTKFASKISKIFSITVEPVEIRLYASNDEGDETELLLVADQLRSLSADKKYNSQYTIAWLKHFVKNTSAGYVQVSINDDYPMVLEAETQDYYARMIVAPIIQS